MALPVCEVGRFTSAVYATNRSAFSRFVAARGIHLNDPASKAATRASFDSQGPLLDEQLARLCKRTLAASLGPPVSATTVTIWEHLRRTGGGVAHTFDWAGFANQHAVWAGMVAPKGEGHIYSPITTSNGFRLSEFTTLIHILVLDCDGTGTWDAIWSVLTDLGLAAITHQSGGTTANTPKWRVLIPLAAPFMTSAGCGGINWKMAYAMARVVFGALGQLRGAGFDPATDNMNNAWYPGYRRDYAAAPRSVHCNNGSTLDLARLISLLPTPAMGPTAIARRPWTAVTPSLLELAFEESGLLGHALDGGRSAVICPWNDCHSCPLPTNVEPTSASVLFPPNSAANIGAFFCAHASCGSKLAEEVLDMLPGDAVHRARLRHLRGGSGGAGSMTGGGLPRLPAHLPRLPTRLP